MYISETTAEERLTVTNAVGTIFTDIERAKSVLNDVWLEYFDKANPEPLESGVVSAIGDILYIVVDVLHDAITEYCMTVGEDWYGGVKAYIAGADVAKSNIFVENNRGKLPHNGRAIMHMTNEQATAAIKEAIDVK